jgi:hypothetical protein
VLLDHVVDAKVVQAGLAGELFAVGCFAGAGRAGDDNVGRFVVRKIVAVSVLS